MSELDKYFEKARNVEPIYEEDDAKKLLYGKLSDGGIATNLYNKIKVFPMITAIITSVATIATIAFFSLSSPEVRVEQPSKIISQKSTSTSSVNSTPDTDELKEKKIITRSVIANHNNVGENETANTREKAESKTWTDDNKIDIKSVNSLKLTKDELSELGIEIDSKSFKVNAFDKYTYTINQNNDKQRAYYNKDEDHDALPTPAMVTTSTGFKTLTLFKKGNVEATVERFTNKNNDGEIKDQNVNKEEFDLQKQFANAPKYNMNNQSFADYKKSLSGNKDSAEIVKQMENYEAFEVVVNGKKTTVSIADILNNADSKDKEMLKMILKKSFVADNDSNGKALDLAVNVKMKDEDEATELLKLNVDIDNKGKFDSNKIVLDSVQMAKVYAFESQMRDYVDKTKDSSINNKNLPDDLARALDSILKQNKIEVDPEFQRRLQGNTYMRDLLQRKSDSLEVIEISKDDIKVVRDKNSVYSSIDFTKFYDVSNKFKNAPEYDFKKGIEKYKLLLIGNVDSAEIIKWIQKPKSFQYDSDEGINSTEKKKYEIKLDGKTFSIDYDEIIKDGKLDQIKYKEFMLGIGKELGKDINVDAELSDASSNKVEKYQLNIKTEIEVDEGENNQEFTLKPGQKVWGDEDNDSNNSSSKLYSNMSFDFLEYNINELIPIEISFDGVNTDFIVWYEATEDFLKRLPRKILEKINPELVALTEQNDHCENEPIEKKDAVMDVWSGCSGAIKEMKVFPNPATSNSNVEFELEDSRVISISIYDLSGKLIKNVKTGMSLGKGNTSESLNLTGVNPGLYYVVVKSEKGEQALQRIIIE